MDDCKKKFSLKSSRVGKYYLPPVVCMVEVNVCGQRDRLSLKAATDVAKAGT